MTPQLGEVQRIELRPFAPHVGLAVARPHPTVRVAPAGDGGRRGEHVPVAGSPMDPCMFELTMSIDVYQRISAYELLTIN